MKHDPFGFGAPTPVLRLIDEDQTRTFYADFLGFAVDWEHRFEEGMPLYIQVSQGGCMLQLTGHFGDCVPGGKVRIPVSDIRGYQQRLVGKFYKHARPGLSEDGKEMTVTDPSGNRLVFYQQG